MRAGCTAMTQRPQERHCGACRAALYITACSPPSSALISRFAESDKLAAAAPAAARYITE